MTKFKAQLRDVTKAMARPFSEGGNISLKTIQVTGPKPKEKAQT